MNDEPTPFNLNFPTEPQTPEPQPPKRQKPKPQKATPKKRGPKPGFKRKAAAPVASPKAVAAALDLEEADWKVIKYLAELPVERRNMIILIANRMSR